MKNKKNDTFKRLRITKHFLDRFNQRVNKNSKKIKSYGHLKSILKQTLNARERLAVDLFHRSTEVELPMGKHMMIIKSSRLITIY